MAHFQAIIRIFERICTNLGDFERKFRFIINKIN